MNQQIQLFENHEIMILGKADVDFDFKGDFLISAKDVAIALEYQGEKATSNILKFCKSGQVFTVHNSNLLNRNVRKLHNTGESFITNYGLNRVFGQSAQPKAEKFQDWLYEDVVPSIQNHGAYLTPSKVEEVLLNPDTIIQLATQLKQEREAKAQLQHQLEQDKPKVLFADAVTASKTSILIGELAKILRQNGIETGQQRLFKWLRDNGYLIRRKGTDYNMPTQRAMELELFEIKETTISHSDGHITISKTPKVTGKGQIYFIDRLSKVSRVI